MDVEITELEKIDADRVDGVGMPANGIPILMMKQVAPEVTPDAEDGPGAEEPALDREAVKQLSKAILADFTASPRELWKAVDRKGNVDEQPDIDLGNQILALIGQAIAAEAAEMAAGQAGEADDILELACAAQAVRCWRDGEQAVSLGDVMPASMLMQSAASAAFVQSVAKGELQLRVSGWPDAKVAEWTAMLEEVVKAKHSAADRRKLAEQGNALSDGSYPIADEHDLHSAAILARSGHGDVEGAKRLIARRAKELGVKNPLDNDDDTSKSQLAEEGTSVDTVVKGSDIEKMIADAVTKATAASEGRITALEAELAKVKATPVPGGPVMSAAAAGRKPAEGETDHAAKAVYYDEWADRISDPVEADRYRQLAARERAQITT